MRLFQQEFYKLCRGKLFIAGTVISVLLLCLYFLFLVSEETATVDGNYYTGYEAVQINRQITKEVEGALTDEKVDYIVKRYGFPPVVEEGYRTFLDGNYLNKFVVEYLADGYLFNSEDYRIAGKAYPIAETELGSLRKAMGKEIMFGYTTGWTVFLNLLLAGMLLGSILIIFSISVVFTEESQCRMRPLLFTTWHGKEKDAAAKIAAAFTLSILIYGIIVCLDFLLCGLVYGFDGADCIAGLVTDNLNPRFEPVLFPISRFIGIELLFDLLAVISLCAMVLYISSCFHNNFHAIAVSAALWGAPVLIRILFGGFLWFFISGTPLFLIMTNNAIEIWNIRFLPAGFAVFVILFCTLSGYRTYRSSQIV